MADDLFNETAPNLAVITEPKTADPQPEKWEMDWNDGPEIVVEEQPALAVYSNRAGGIVVRQRAAWDEEEDAVVILSTPEVAATVMAAIKREMGRK